MKLVFSQPSQNAPDKLLANFKIQDCPLPGIELRECAIWTSDKGEWVAFPGRQFEKNGRKQTVRSLMPMNDEWTAINAFTEAIIRKYKEWAATQTPADEAAPADEENPFA